MPTIKIDNEVFAFLQEKAVPLIDDPNRVLRRLLLPPSELPPNERTSRGAATVREPGATRSAEQVRDTDSFVSQVLEAHFGGSFRKRGPYRYLFESPSRLVYFQNFNQSGSDALWYRLRSSALEMLRDSTKESTVCLTNPSDNLFYALPMEEVDRKAQAAGWDRDDLEVNIDHVNRRWRELDWDISKYLHRRAV